MKRYFFLSLCAAMLIAQFGCRHPCERRPLFADHAAPKSLYVPPPPPQPIVQPPGVIQQSGGFPVLPPEPKGPPSISKTPPVETKEPPRPESKRDAPPRIDLYAPEPIEKEVDKKPATDGLLPPIAQFADVRQNVYTGLRPNTDGLDWLKSNRIGTIIHIRLPDTDDANDRREIEKRGITYLSLEVSPKTLSKEKAEDFVQMVRNAAKQGVFVYDQDGALAGAMWYLFFRRGEILDDDASQLHVRRLGLPLNRDDLSRDMWLAVQRLLSENNP